MLCSLSAAPGEWVCWKNLGWQLYRPPWFNPPLHVMSYMLCFFNSVVHHTIHPHHKMNLDNWVLAFLYFLVPWSSDTISWLLRYSKLRLWLLPCFIPVVWCNHVATLEQGTSWLKVLTSWARAGLSCCETLSLVKILLSNDSHYSEFIFLCSPLMWELSNECVEGFSLSLQNEKKNPCFLKINPVQN